MARHVPLSRAILRVGADGRADDVHLALAAARAMGVAVELSVAGELSAVLLPGGGGGPGVEVVVEDPAALVARLPAAGADKLRLIGSAGADLRLAALDAGVWVDDVAVVGAPALEALRWVREQAVSETLHRHGEYQAPRQRPPPALTGWSSGVRLAATCASPGRRSVRLDGRRMERRCGAGPRGRAGGGGPVVAGPVVAGPVVAAQGLAKRYGDTVAVAGIDLRVDGGQIHGLVGPNGAGKTTLLAMLFGLVEPDAGTLQLLGRDREEPSGGGSTGSPASSRRPASTRT